MKVHFREWESKQTKKVHEDGSAVLRAHFRLVVMNLRTDVDSLKPFSSIQTQTCTELRVF